MSNSNNPISALPRTHSSLRVALDRLAQNASPTGGGVLQSVFDSIFDKATAGQNVALAQIVYVVSAGNVDLAKANSATTYKAIGVVTEAALSGATAEFQTQGIVGGFSGLTVGARYYLSAATAGAVVTPPDATTGQYVVFLGIAVSATELSFIPSNPVLL